MTYTTFMKLYQHYKNDWDYEQYLRIGKITYSEAHERSIKAEEWF